MFRASELQTLMTAMQNQRLVPRTSSIGRLFDAIAALGQLSHKVSFEGQAAMALEFAASEEQLPPYDMLLTNDTPAQWNWQPMVHQILDDLEAEQPLAVISRRFHETLALGIVQVAERCRCPRVGLTGGCFQNDLLLRRARLHLSAAGFEVYTQQQVPPGDGGIALGQIWAAALMNRANSCKSDKE
jgi:hydrogenase maturation protein HypF